MHKQHIEPSEQLNNLTGAPRILDTAPIEGRDDNVVGFRITEDTTSADLLATIAFLKPDAERRAKFTRNLLRIGIEKMSGLSGLDIAIPDPSGQPSDIATFSRTVNFSSEAKLEDVEKVMQDIYTDKDAAQNALENLLADIVDNGVYNGRNIIVTQENEFLAATEQSIEAEIAMAALAIQFADEGEL